MTPGVGAPPAQVDGHVPGRTDQQIPSIAHPPGCAISAPRAHWLGLGVATSGGGALLLACLVLVTMDTYGHLYPDAEEALSERLDARIRAAQTDRRRTLTGGNLVSVGA